MALQQISRLCEEVDELGSVYLKASEEIDTLKEAKREVKRELKKARDELEALRTTLNAGEGAGDGSMRSDRKLVKADKKTEIAELERQLGLVEEGLGRLVKKKGRVFDKREELKARMMRKVVDVQCGREGVLIMGASDVAAVRKMAEWVPVEPRGCVVSGSVSAREVEEIVEEAARLNIRVDFPD